MHRPTDAFAQAIHPPMS